MLCCTELLNHTGVIAIASHIKTFFCRLEAAFKIHLFGFEYHWSENEKIRAGVMILSSSIPDQVKLGYSAFHNTHRFKAALQIIADTDIVVCTNNVCDK